ncbi:MAG: quorum-sensing autoinducer CAI-1 synthase [Candidatus Marinimicrobia bacterium]|nr:quorum-sensing autoinducer CAI-1 synthase [Candidatus Neomarinimicrobiota bacterium]
MGNTEQLFRDISAGTVPGPPVFLSAKIADYRQRAMGHGSHILQGGIPGDGAIILSSNDYLCLAANPVVTRAQADYLVEQGRGLMRSDVFRHELGPLASFEQRMAQWTGMPSALLTQSGWNANVGLIQALADKQVPVYLDMEAHMSLWEGTHSAQAKPRPFRHNSAQSLENMLKRHGPGIIAIDSVYSTSGSVAPLADMAEVSSRYGAILVVDESHSLGLFGPMGAGMVAALNLQDQVDFITASLSKTFASRGGIIIGSSENLEYFRYNARPAIFSSSVMDHEAAGFLATQEIVAGAALMRAELQAKADYLREGLAAAGYNVSASQSQIISLVSGADGRTIRLRDVLEKRGVFGSVFCWPATGRKRSLVRFSLHGNLTQSQLDRVIDVCAEIAPEVEPQLWPVPRS